MRKEITESEKIIYFAQLMPHIEAISQIVINRPDLCTSLFFTSDGYSSCIVYPHYHDKKSFSEIFDFQKFSDGEINYGHSIVDEGESK